MRRVLGSAAAVIMNTSEAAARVRSAFPELGNRVHGIPMGFDPSDFEGPREATPDGIFRIVHTGTMYTEEGLRHRRTRRIRRLLGGMPNPTVDFLPRSHVYLLRALAVLEQRDASLVAPVEVHLAGAMTVGDREVAASSRRTVVHGFVSHADTMALVGSADLLFLPMHAMDGRAGLVPTKTYEYLGSGRPILAAVPDGDARELMEACGTATAVYPDDVQGMARVIEQHVLRWRAGEDPPALDAAVAAGYTWESIGNRVADVIEDVVGRTRS
jgi:glycosyltransferase involved in cell wall biosynthesis